MKKLLLLRHAKSDWTAAFSHDHDRPLSSRGERAARRVGRFLAVAGPRPDRVLSSTALRAHRTVELAAEAGGWSCPVETSALLYDSDPATVLGVVHGVADSVHCLLLAGHEPTWSELLSGLVGGGRLRLVTGALARVDFETERWEQVMPGGGTLRWLLPPKLLHRFPSSGPGSGGGAVVA